MKQVRRIILPVTLSIALLMPALTHAVSQYPAQIQENKREIIEAVQQTRQEVKEQIQENRSLMSQAKLQVVQKIQNRIRQRLESRFSHLQKIENIITDKLKQKRQSDFDTSSVEIELAKVNQFKSAYQDYLSAYDQLVDDMNRSDTPTQLRNELNQQARLANQQLIQYRHTLKRALRLLINIAKTQI